MGLKLGKYLQLLDMNQVQLFDMNQDHGLHGVQEVLSPWEDKLKNDKETNEVLTFQPPPNLFI